MTPGPSAALVDVHVHLPTYPDPAAVVASARARGIHLVSVTVSAAEAEQNMLLRSIDPSVVKCFLGVHPSEAVSADGSLDQLAPLWEGADGVGEVGLDPKYSGIAPASAQMRVFEAQVEAAERLEKPLQVHSRGAERACLDVLEGRSVRSVLMHWFEGEELLERLFLRPGRFVSFGPAILYSKKLVRIAKRCPTEAVLIESDGPVPFAALGGAEGPGLIPSVAFKLAEVWGKSLEETAHQLSLNAERYFE